MEYQPLLVTAALVVRDDGILLLKRGREPYLNQWGFPGGVGGFKVSKNPYEAVVSEVLGDVGCTFKGEFFMQNYFAQNEPTVTLFYVGSIEGEPVPRCEGVLLAEYVPIREAVMKDLAFDHNIVLEEYFNTLDGF